MMGLAENVPAIIGRIYVDEKPASTTTRVATDMTRKNRPVLFADRLDR